MIFAYKLVTTDSPDVKLTNYFIEETRFDRRARDKYVRARNLSKIYFT